MFNEPIGYDYKSLGARRDCFYRQASPSVGKRK